MRVEPVHATQIYTRCFFYILFVLQNSFFTKKYKFSHLKLLKYNHEKLTPFCSMTLLKNYVDFIKIVVVVTLHVFLRLLIHP